MANQKQLRILKEGDVDAWNEWRENNSDLFPDLTEANLVDSCLRNANLSDANLSGANLSGANLSGANLKDSHLWHANLKHANLQRANIQGADLRHANLQRANIQDANLMYADLEHAHLKHANLFGSCLKGTNLIAVNPEGVDLKGVNLKGVNLRGIYPEENAIINHFNLEGAILAGHDLRSALLEEFNLKEVDLRGAILWGAHLKGSNLSSANLRDAELELANLENANLRGANLRGANLRGANLKGANLSGVDLEQANLGRFILKDAKLTDANKLNAFQKTSENLSRKLFKARKLFKPIESPKLPYLKDTNLNNANLGNANLRGANLFGADLQGADLTGANMESINLKDVKMEGVNLRGTHLRGFNLSGADFKYANLSDVNLSGANLQGAILTGVCIEDWNINSNTNLDDVICEYVYLKGRQQERRPADPNRNFEPGEFAKLVEEYIETVDLIFKEGIDWRAFLTSFQDLQVEYEEQNISIQAIEKKSDGAFVIRLNVPPDADDAKKAEIESKAKQSYETNLKVLEAKYRAELPAHDREITLYKERSADMKEIATLLATRPIVEAKEVTNRKIYTKEYKETHLHDKSRSIETRDSSTYYENYNPSQQTLAEAAAEIQKLLKQLQQTNPTASETEMIAYVNDETTPSFKRKAVAALKAAGETAIDEFFQNPYVKVGKAAIMGWME